MIYFQTLHSIIAGIFLYLLNKLYAKSILLKSVMIHFRQDNRKY